MKPNEHEARGRAQRYLWKARLYMLAHYRYKSIMNLFN